MMKKLLALLLVIVMCATMFAACGSNEDGKDAGGDQQGEIKGETYDTGDLSVLVPEGWTAIPVADLWAEEEGATDPTTVRLCKGGSTEMDLLSYPSLQIHYYDENTYMSEPSTQWYDDPADLDPLTLGGKTWKGFSASSFGDQLIILWTGEQAGDQYDVTIWPEKSEGSFSLEDADVQAIIASIQPSK